MKFSDEEELRGPVDIPEAIVGVDALPTSADGSQEKPALRL